MHEMGIAMQIMNIVQGSLPPGEDLRIKSISLKVGKLTAIVPRSLEFCMEVVTKGTPAEGAALVFTEVPVQLECDDCGEVSVIDQAPFSCRSCGSDKVEVISGREMIVESIEVAEAGESPAAGREGV